MLAFIRTTYRRMGLDDLTTAFNAEFGLDKTIDQIRSTIRNHSMISGRTGRFESGHRPWNNGTKGQGLTGANRNSFKPGNVPVNVKPLGYERIGKDGYLEIKIAEPNPYTGAATRFLAKHVVVWEEANGSVPQGMIIRFLDGDKTNCTLANLVLVSRGENAILNKSGLTKLPADVMPSCIAYVRLRKKMCEKAKMEMR
jgi:hypothetical protein